MLTTKSPNLIVRFPKIPNIAQMIPSSSREQSHFQMLADHNCFYSVKITCQSSLVDKVYHGDTASKRSQAYFGIKFLVTYQQTNTDIGPIRSNCFNSHCLNVGQVKSRRAKGDLLGITLITLAIISIRCDKISLNTGSVHVLEHGDILTTESDAGNT